MILPPSDWKPWYNNCVRAGKSQRWMPVHDKNDPAPASVLPPELQNGQFRPNGKKNPPAIIASTAFKARELMTHPYRHLNLCFRKTKRMVKTNRANLMKIHSQHREAMALTLSICLQYTDLATMMVGYRDEKGEFHHVTVEWLGKQEGMTPSRAERGFKAIKDFGFIANDPQADQICERNPDGSYTGKASPKVMSEKVFEYFGHSQKYIKDQRQFASNKLNSIKDAEQKDAEQRQRTVDAMRQQKYLRDLEQLVGGNSGKKSKKAKSPAITVATGFRSLADILSD